MPTGSDDCLCRDCLRRLVEKAERDAAG